MPSPVFISDEDLFLRIGGRAALAQLMDPDKSGSWDTQISLRARADACNIVIEAAGVQVDLAGNTVEEFRDRYSALVTHAAQKALYFCWLYGTGGQACPERITALNDEVETALENLAKRRRKHGATDYSPQPAQEVRGSIDNDPGRTRMTLSSWRSGFC